MPDGYLERVQRAEVLFFHQRVYDAESAALVALTSTTTKGSPGAELRARSFSAVAAAAEAAAAEAAAAEAAGAATDDEAEATTDGAEADGDDDNGEEVIDLVGVESEDEGGGGRGGASLPQQEAELFAFLGEGFKFGDVKSHASGADHLRRHRLSVASGGGGGGGGGRGGGRGRGRGRGPTPSSKRRRGSGPLARLLRNSARGTRTLRPISGPLTSPAPQQRLRHASANRTTLSRRCYKPNRTPPQPPQLTFLTEPRGR